MNQTEKEIKAKREIFQFSIFLLRMAFAVFLSFIAQMIPQLQQYYHLSLNKTGLFMTFQSLGGVIFLLLGVRIFDRFDKRWMMLFGGVGLSLFLCLSATLPSLGILFLFIAVIGCANAIIDTMSNAITGELHRTKQGAYLNLLNVFFSIGAISGPFFADKLFQRYGLRQVFVVFGGVVAAITVLYAASFFLNRTLKIEAGSSLEKRSEDAGQKRSKPDLSRGLRMGVIIFLTAAATITLMTWLSMFTIDRFHITGSYGALALSLFWAGRIVGLLMTAKLAAKVRPQTMIFWCALSGAFCFLIGLTLDNLGAFLVCTALTGMMFGNCEPQAMALMMETFPRRTGYAVSLFAIVASGAVILVPYLVGLLLGIFGISAGMYIAGGFMLLLAVAALVKDRELSEKPATETK